MKTYLVTRLRNFTEVSTQLVRAANKGQACEYAIELDDEWDVLEHTAEHLCCECCGIDYSIEGYEADG